MNKTQNERIKKKQDSGIINILRKMFEANPGKSTIELRDNCTDCGCEVKIEITSTSGGYGLQSGALFKGKASGYFAKCPDCNTLYPKTNDIKLKIKNSADKGSRKKDKGRRKKDPG